MPEAPLSPKIFNDPVHGFVTVPRGLLLALIDHPWFQRLRSIRQMGLSSLVYPGAVHTRLSHALGAFHLTQQALDVLATKGIDVTEAERDATLAAILLHDLGHGPFSHGLESVLVPGTHHEELTLALMHGLNTELGGRLDVALRVFTGTHPKRFLHELISSQLDMDRLDYLIRDSFFTGVQEGIVGSDRILKTLTVQGGHLVIEEKGIYSVEKFIVARRLMYWQVYLHRTALGAEKLLIRTLERARALAHRGQPLHVHDNLLWFLQLPDAGAPTPVTHELVERFVRLGDDDITLALKQWQHHPDAVLRDLATRLLHRRLLKVRFSSTAFSPAWVAQQRQRFADELQLPNPTDLDCYVFGGEVSNLPYYQHTSGGQHEEGIRILFKDGQVRDLAQAADMSNIQALSQRLTKYYFCTPAY